jgi:hypothetical protein
LDGQVVQAPVRGDGQPEPVIGLPAPVLDERREMTMNVYGHVALDDQRAALDRLNGLLDEQALLSDSAVKLTAAARPGENPLASAAVEARCRLMPLSRCGWRSCGRGDPRWGDPDPDGDA